MAVAGLLGEFVASRPDAAAGVRIVELGLSSQTLGCELPLVVSPFCNLQASSLSSIARSRCRQTAHFPFLRPNAIGTAACRSCSLDGHAQCVPQLRYPRAASRPARCRQTHPPVADTPTLRMESPNCHHFHWCCVQGLSIDCREGLAFKPRSLQLLGHGGLRALNLICYSLSADTLQHLGCLTGLTRLEVTSLQRVHAPGDPDTAASPATAVAHLTALSGLTRLAHLDLDLGNPFGEEVPAAELLAALPRAPLETVRRAGLGHRLPWLKQRPATRCHHAFVVTALAPSSSHERDLACSAVLPLCLCCDPLGSLQFLLKARSGVPPQHTVPIR
jgi:hypothetical protein